MRNFWTSFILLLVLALKSEAQVSYAGRIETGYQYYLFRMVTVDPGPSWKGYNLDDKQSGFSIRSSNGLTFADRSLFTGVGIGLFSFEGIGGTSFFGDFEYLPLKNRISPLYNLRLGYNHIWNQYEGGTGSMHTEFGLGLNFKIREKTGIYIKLGMLFTQQSLLIPITLGFRY